MSIHVRPVSAPVFWGVAAHADTVATAQSVTASVQQQVFETFILWSFL
jgi:hypothetical protein